MKRRYLAAILFFFVFEGCSMFRKTNKTSNSKIQSSAKHLEASQLILERSGKETQVFTYWNDSGFYQFQNIKEQLDQAKSNKLKANEKQLDSQRSLTKKTGPVKIWMYIGTAVIITIFLWVCFTYIKKRHGDTL